MIEPKPFLEKSDDVADWTSIRRGLNVYLYHHGQLHSEDPIRVTEIDAYQLSYVDSTGSASTIDADSDQEHPHRGWQIRRIPGVH